MVNKNTAYNMIIAFVTILFLIISLNGCLDNDSGSPTEKQSLYLDKVKDLYEKAKESGEKVPDDVVDWVSEDIAKLGDWEYKIIILDSQNNEELEKKLNRLGNERWECFWVDKTDSGTQFFFKKPARSYLRSIPVSDLLKFVPGTESEE